MADPLNATVPQLTFDSLGPLGTILTSIFTMIGGFLGLYVIVMIFKYYESKRLKRTLGQISEDMAGIRKSLKRIESALVKRK